VIEKIEGGFKVKVGSIAHPMEEKHFIEWIQIVADSKTYRQFLNPGQTPAATFMLEAATVTAREYLSGAAGAVGENVGKMMVKLF
jgi:superoxide reductase